MLNGYEKFCTLQYLVIFKDPHCYRHGHFISHWKEKNNPKGLCLRKAGKTVMPCFLFNLPSASSHLSWLHICILKVFKLLRTHTHSHVCIHTHTFIYIYGNGVTEIDVVIIVGKNLASGPVFAVKCAASPVELGSLCDRKGCWICMGTENILSHGSVHFCWCTSLVWSFRQSL